MVGHSWRKHKASKKNSIEATWSACVFFLLNMRVGQAICRMLVEMGLRASLVLAFLKVLIFLLMNQNWRRGCSMISLELGSI
jgi:hypothetical protein